MILLKNQRDALNEARSILKPLGVHVETEHTNRCLLLVVNHDRLGRCTTQLAQRSNAFGQAAQAARWAEGLARLIRQENAK